FAFFGPLAAALVLTTSPSAFAQEPPAPAAADARAPAPATSGEPIRITATCSLLHRPGIAEAEARTAADVVCHELTRQQATGQYEVSFGALGGRTLVVLARRSGPDTSDERRTFLSGLDEIDLAAPRLVAALVEGKPLADTRTVDTVLASEARASRLERGSMGF